MTLLRSAPAQSPHGRTRGDRIHPVSARHILRRPRQPNASRLLRNTRRIERSRFRFADGRLDRSGLSAAGNSYRKVASTRTSDHLATFGAGTITGVQDVRVPRRGSEDSHSIGGPVPPTSPRWRSRPPRRWRRMSPEDRIRAVSSHVSVGVGMPMEHDELAHVVRPIARRRRSCERRKSPPADGASRLAHRCREGQRPRRMNSRMFVRFFLVFWLSAKAL